MTISLVKNANHGFDLINFSFQRTRSTIRLFTLYSGTTEGMNTIPRAGLDDSKYAFHWATGIFAVLMALIATLGCFDIPWEVRLLCIVPILGLATSTIDSIAVALHECVNKWVGTGLAMIIICFWWILLDHNAIQVWNYHGVVRCIDAVLIIALSAYWWYNHRKNNLALT